MGLQSWTRLSNFTSLIWLFTVGMLFEGETDFPYVGVEMYTFLELRVQEGEVYSHFIVLGTLLSV